MHPFSENEPIDQELFWQKAKPAQQQQGEEIKLIYNHSKIDIYKSLRSVFFQFFILSIIYFAIINLSAVPAWEASVSYLLSVGGCILSISFLVSFQKYFLSYTAITNQRVLIFNQQNIFFRTITRKPISIIWETKEDGKYKFVIPKKIEKLVRKKNLTNIYFS